MDSVIRCRLASQAARWWATAPGRSCPMQGVIFNHLYSAVRNNIPY